MLFIKNETMFRSFDLSDDYFERFATMLHELRHFHDALLCLPLFDKFLLQHKIAWYTPTHQPARYRYLPRQVTDPIWDRDPGLATLKRMLLDADADLYDRHPELETHSLIDGDEVTLDHLLEASAIIG